MSRKTPSINGAMSAYSIVRTLARLQIDDCYDSEDSNEQRKKLQTSMASAIALVHDILESDVRRAVLDGAVAFSAQDDERDLAHSQGSGFTTNLYQQRWNELENAPWRSSPGFADDGQATSKMESSMRRVIARGHFARAVRKDVIFYLGSNPGRRTNPSNHISKRLKAFVRKGDAEDEKLRYFLRVLDYCLYIMDAADKWATALGLEFPPCAEVDWQIWDHNHKESAGMMQLLQYAISDWPMFDSEKSGERVGSDCPKGNQYLVCAMRAAGWSVETMQGNLRPFFKGRVAGVANSGIPLVEGVSRAMDFISRYGLDRNESVKDALRKGAGSLNRTIRDRSPIRLLPALPIRRINHDTIPEEEMSGQPSPTLGKHPKLKPSPAK